MQTTKTQNTIANVENGSTPEKQTQPLQSLIKKKTNRMNSFVNTIIYYKKKTNIMNSFVNTIIYYKKN